MTKSYWLEYSKIIKMHLLKIKLSNCSIIQHKIDTGQAAPIRGMCRPIQRTPQGFEEEDKSRSWEKKNNVGEACSSRNQQNLELNAQKKRTSKSKFQQKENLSR